MFFPVTALLYIFSRALQTAALTQPGLPVAPVDPCITSPQPGKDFKTGDIVAFSWCATHISLYYFC